MPTKREFPTSKPATPKGQAPPVQPAQMPAPGSSIKAGSVAVQGRPPASGQAGLQLVPMKDPPSTPFKSGVNGDVSMSPPVPKASAKPPSPAKDVHMSDSTPIPAKVVGTPLKPGYTPVKSPDYKKARRTLFEDAEAIL